MQFPVEISVRHLQHLIRGSVYLKNCPEERLCFAVTDIESDLIGHEFLFKKLNEFHLQCIESPEGTEPTLLRCIMRKLKQIYLKPKIRIDGQYANL
jgi:hypothetical protein